MVKYKSNLGFNKTHKSVLIGFITLALMLVAIPLTVLMSQKPQNVIQEAYMDSGVKFPVVTSISTEAREIITWTDGTKRAKVWLKATAYDPNGGKVQVAFRVRAKGSCANPLTSTWISDTAVSGIFSYGAPGLKIGQVYEYSAKARKISSPLYSQGPLFCGTDGWHPAKAFYIDSNYRLINL